MARHVKVVMGSVADGHSDQAGSDTLCEKIYTIVSDANVSAINSVAITKFGSFVVAVIVYETV
jgi:hypothetical protein